jgi:hypothetical protein
MKLHLGGITAGQYSHPDKHTALLSKAPGDGRIYRAGELAWLTNCTTSSGEAQPATSVKKTSQSRRRV